MKKILMIGPFPGGLNGQTIANKTLYNGLKYKYKVDKINTLKEEKFLDKSNQGKFILKKFLKILLEIFGEVKKISTQKYDLVYMTSGQSFLGFMRFSPYMLICIIKNIPYYNHIHGGYFRKMYNVQSKFKQELLKFFIKKSAGMIVLGNSLKTMFNEIIPNDKIFVCENGVEDEIVATEEEIKENMERYQKDNKKKVLYLSNLMIEKGILDLLKASEEFNDNEIEINLAGAIEPGIKVQIENYLKQYPNKIKYHGIIKGKEKKKLLLENYIFILPTYYSNEGQPISILEAYLNGCAVITDENIGGIQDIFKKNINGIHVENKNIRSIYEALKKIEEDKFSYSNYKNSKKIFLSKYFVQRIEKIMIKR